jgi:hypothetical protein
MLKNIRLHIEKDEKKQTELDEEFAKKIINTHSSNVMAFQRNIPSLLPYVKDTDLANYSIFVNKYGEGNIIDYGMGRTFYGFHPEEEVLEQLSQIEQHCPEIKFKAILIDQEGSSSAALKIEDLANVKLKNQQPPMPYEIECLVVLGCGLGIHLSHLLKQHKIKNLLIYEPELQYFQCSVMTTSWQDIFTLAKEHNTAIFLQLEKDARDLIQDIHELIDHCAISSFHLYKHYNHQVFDSVHKDISERSWTDIENNGFSIKSKESYLDFLPSWTPNIDLATHSLLTAPNDKLSNNLNAFKKFFPEIYKQYKQYTPKKWRPIANIKGEVNLIKIDTLNTWYGESPKLDCILNFENFNEQPNKDGLVLGYKGTKLAHYIHYQFVKETEELLKQAEEDVGALPDNVASIIMFGLGVGYQLEKLLNEHTVEKLFICEPNPDFFYASLFTIDWQSILEAVEQTESRIYLNIGDDGTNLFRDLLDQFYAIGPYILNSTYFYQSYYNASLNSAISQLREQLQIVISMGEYFDHAYYGIAHTKEGMRRKIPVLAADPASKLSYDEKEVPIFIVGNGPSLDRSIDAIKEWQGQAIVVSCGTTLQALHRHGITPDFHAEIEQNRSTFDWAVLIGDLEYLKNITLISCNGIHPDTCDLYKDVMIAFKEGESSTVSALNVLGRENFETLLNAFPTVSNFAIDLFTTIGFTSIYMIGVDLGFVDVKHHHSKSSGYYQENGKETYDYTKSANTSLIVPGNFRPTVNTKHEFKVSRQVIEQVTSGKSKGQEFYNCSDGAKIQGALPIRPDELLIVVTEAQKVQIVEKLKTLIFSAEGLDSYSEKFDKQFSQSLLIEELSSFKKLIKKDVTGKEDVEQIIKIQKEMLFSSYKNGKSLLFYYLYGTVNYTNALLTKLVSKDVLSAKKALIEWSKILEQLLECLKFDITIFDCSFYKRTAREHSYLNQIHTSNTMLLITDSKVFAEGVNRTITAKYPWITELKTLSPSQISDAQSVEFTHLIIYILDKNFDSSNIQNLLDNQSGKALVLLNEQILESNNESQRFSSLMVTLPATKPVKGYINNLLYLASISISACVAEHSFGIIYPKYLRHSDMPESDDWRHLNTTQEIFNTECVIDFYDYIICFNSEKDYAPNVISLAGTRGKKLSSSQKYVTPFSQDVDTKTYHALQQTYLKNQPNLFDGTD